MQYTLFRDQTSSTEEPELAVKNRVRKNDIAIARYPGKIKDCDWAGSGGTVG